MIYPRLKVAKDLLTEDGIIFISIGDDESANLIKVCDELFGEKNFIADICHKHRASVSNDRIISENHNHILFYTKNISATFAQHKMIGEDPILEGFNKEDSRGKYKLAPVDGPGGAKKGNPHYEFMGINGYWRYSKETMQKLYDEGLLVITANNIQKKYYESQAQTARRTVTTWWDEDFLTSSATSSLQKIMGTKTFDNPKNVNLLLRMLRMVTHFDKDAYILDFFSGSATTAHAVMQYNSEDGGNRKFILVQLPELTDEKSEAYKAGYKNICEIGKERIRRAGNKIKDQLETDLGKIYKELYDSCGGAIESPNPSSINYFNKYASPEQSEKFSKLSQEYSRMKQNYEHLDTGFRVLKLDSSNMQDVYYAPSEYNQADLFAKTENVKADRTPEDLLFQVMLELGATLDSKIEQQTIEGKTIFNVADGYLVACFDAEIDDAVVTAIAKMEPQYAVFRDSSMADDSTATNFEQIFKTYSPNTTTKVL
jgi:Adenine specific DNA methylase Mod